MVEEIKPKLILKCIKCDTQLKKPADTTDIIIGLVCDNNKCERFGLLSVVAKKEYEQPKIIIPEEVQIINPEDVDERNV